MLFCFSYVVASGSRLCVITSCFIWVSLNNCYARVCLIHTYIEGKVVLALNFIKHYAMKAYGGVDV
jgi:hypothetical protein